MIVDATDNFPAHYLINDAAIISGKPFVYGSVVTIPDLFPHSTFRADLHSDAFIPMAQEQCHG